MESREGGNKAESCPERNIGKQSSYESEDSGKKSADSDQDEVDRCVKDGDEREQRDDTANKWSDGSNDVSEDGGEKRSNSGKQISGKASNGPQSQNGMSSITECLDDVVHSNGGIHGNGNCNIDDKGSQDRDFGSYGRLQRLEDGGKIVDSGTLGNCISLAFCHLSDGDGAGADEGAEGNEEKNECDEASGEHYEFSERGGSVWALKRAEDSGVRCPLYRAPVVQKSHKQGSRMG
ncbi:hypothetical protein BOTBODRAFT_33688 [Botryobasidium botryosum FD-172 SS1]|uniref:Uncharacterized protein n=1 Tax=Botryobasidium botryosum (strain FD-172 SS1) TaxID=930990 RepID=A0A067MNE2_BOTB1|nr:hypothetical protein BOTBODRAFT_33688 [Botryobasidium botryosum FD-172 SS1]